MKYFFIIIFFVLLLLLIRYYYINEILIILLLNYIIKILLSKIFLKQKLIFLKLLPNLKNGAHEIVRIFKRYFCFYTL